jgi:hypothetical protein
MVVFVFNAVGTSQGAVPGAKTLPRDEALALICEGHAVAGSTPPSGWAGNGVTLSPYTGRGLAAFQ